MPPRFRTLSDVVDQSVAGRRLAFALTAFFAGMALVLAALGIYAVLAFVVAESAQAFGIRIALGAQRLDIHRLVLGHASRLLITGLTLGLGASLAATRLLSSVLFRVQATDPATYITAAVVLVARLTACEVPAIRATRADPASALRGDT